MGEFTGPTTRGRRVVDLRYEREPKFNGADAINSENTNTDERRDNKYCAEIANF